MLNKCSAGCRLRCIVRFFFIVLWIAEILRRSTMDNVNTVESMQSRDWYSCPEVVGGFRNMRHSLDKIPFNAINHSDSIQWNKCPRNYTHPPPSVQPVVSKKFAAAASVVQQPTHHSPTEYSGVATYGAKRKQVNIHKNLHNIFPFTVCVVVMWLFVYVFPDTSTWRAAVA